MSREKNKIDIEKLLSSFPVPAPPKDLAGRIRAEIPTQMPTAAPFPKRKRAAPFPAWMRAAAVILLAAAGYIGYRLTRPSLGVTPPVAVAPKPSPAERAELVVSPPIATPAPIASQPSGIAQRMVHAVAAPDRPAFLEGLVTDEQGGALPGVTVKVSGKDGDKTAVTDARGHIVLQLPAAGKYKVET
ncbi:MAG: carboxypeptidase-like regulatory domain-containing protein, partial [Thermoanaerobaculia bacterium]